MTNDRIGMIYNFFIFKKKIKKKFYNNSMTNDCIEMICNFSKEKNFFFSNLSRFSGFFFSRYDDVAQIRFCVRFLFSRYDDVA